MPLQTITLEAKPITCARCRAVEATIPTVVELRRGLPDAPRNLADDDGAYLVTSWRPPDGWEYFSQLGDFCPPCAKHVRTAVLP